MKSTRDKIARPARPHSKDSQRLGWEVSQSWDRESSKMGCGPASETGQGRWPEAGWRGPGGQ